MAWARLDDAFWRNPKILAAGNEASGLYARALSYSADNETGGVLTVDTLKTLAGSRWKALSRKLTDAKLFDDLGGTWMIHDYDDPAYGNPATPKARARSEAARESARARWDIPPPDANGMRNASGTHPPSHTESHANGNANHMRRLTQAGASQSQSPSVDSSLRDGPESGDAREDLDHHQIETETQEQLALTVQRLQPTWRLTKIREVIGKARTKSGSLPRTTTAMLIVAVAADSTSPARVLSNGYWWRESDDRYAAALESPKLAEVLEPAS